LEETVPEEIRVYDAESALVWATDATGSG